MANLTSLISGIMGENIESTPVKTQAPEITTDMRENLESKRRQNVGRPKKSTPAKLSNETRATFIVDADIVRKLKYISLDDGQLLKYSSTQPSPATSMKWESENGKIRIQGSNVRKRHRMVKPIKLRNKAGSYYVDDKVDISHI